MQVWLSVFEILINFAREFEETFYKTHRMTDKRPCKGINLKESKPKHKVHITLKHIQECIKSH